jgi:hypothetical protein
VRRRARELRRELANWAGDLEPISEFLYHYPLLIIVAEIQFDWTAPVIEVFTLTDELCIELTLCLSAEHTIHYR